MHFKHLKQLSIAAAIAQWQSAGLVNQRSRVQSSLAAPFWFEVLQNTFNFLDIPFSNNTDNQHINVINILCYLNFAIYKTYINYYLSCTFCNVIYLLLKDNKPLISKKITFKVKSITSANKYL